ncbi:hypothetical protein EQG49_06520 [Periweissella cryptocerci]|uniref:Uncharacterized protein n=1 Tax=Periweissella cryptocerci TaxID=2506420 RepID=A0A4P6YTW7_9LACO|nr:hypothetical protein [Periweissella cryptocerci]QBO36136.1 hypothetical protein EQG49_06520 [Periweissella cryptocerci]
MINGPIFKEPSTQNLSKALEDARFFHANVQLDGKKYGMESNKAGHLVYSVVRVFNGMQPKDIQLKNTVIFDQDSIRVVADDTEKLAVRYQDIAAMHVGVVRNYVNGGGRLRNVYSTVFSIERIEQPNLVILNNNPMLSLDLLHSKLHEQVNLVDDLELDRFGSFSNRTEFSGRLDNEYEKLIAETSYPTYTGDLEKGGNEGFGRHA